jgi:hypothetical protein
MKKDSFLNDCKNNWQLYVPNERDMVGYKIGALFISTSNHNL